MNPTAYKQLDLSLVFLLNEPSLNRNIGLSVK